AAMFLIRYFGRLAAGELRFSPIRDTHSKTLIVPSSAMSALPPKADIGTQSRNVRFVPKADILQCGKERRYSISSSTNRKASLQPQRGNNHDDADRRDVPNDRTRQRKVRSIQKRVDETTPKVQVCSPHRKPIVSAGCRDDENGGDEERERFGIDLECSLNPPGDTGERSTRLLSRTGGPTIAAAPALKVRDNNDMHDSDKDAGRE